MDGEGVTGSLAARIMKRKGRIAELCIGLTANKLIDDAFNWLLYPYVIYRFGIFIGGTVMTILSLLACLLSLWFYDWSKRDWLGIEAIKSLKESDGKGRAGRLFAWVLQKGDLLTAMILSIKFDPFITTVYMRRGAYNGMSSRDWRIFLGSLLFGNAYWTLACFMGVSLVEWVYEGITKSLQ